MKIDTVRCTPALWLEVQLSILRGERIESKMRRISELPVRERGLPLLRLLGACDESVSDEAEKILDGVDGRWLRSGDLAVLDKPLSDRADWLPRLVADRFEGMANDGELSEDVRAVTFQLLAKTLPLSLENERNTRAVASALLVLGGDQGLRLVEAQLESQKPGVPALLDVLGRSNQPQSAEVVERLLREDEQARKKQGRGPTSQTVSLLVLLSKTRPDVAERRLLEILELPDYPAPSAAEALFDIYRLPHPRGSLMDWGDENGLDSLSEDEATTYLADRFGYYVGHMLAHTLLEEMGGELPRMRDALKKVNAPVGAQLIDKIIKVLPAGGLPKDEKARLKYLENEGSGLEGTVFRLMKTHEYVGEDFVLLAWRYEVKNRKGFRKI